MYIFLVLQYKLTIDYHPRRKMVPAQSINWRPKVQVRYNWLENCSQRQVFYNSKVISFWCLLFLFMCSVVNMSHQTDIIDVAQCQLFLLFTVSQVLLSKTNMIWFWFLWEMICGFWWVVLAISIIIDDICIGCVINVSSECEVVDGNCKICVGWKRA